MSLPQAAPPAIRPAPPANAGRNRYADLHAVTGLHDTSQVSRCYPLPVREVSWRLFRGRER
jgi:hypothetical protein